MIITKKIFAALIGGFLLAGCQTTETVTTAPTVAKAPSQQSQAPNICRTRSGAVCGDRMALLKKLAGSYEETPRSIALAANGSVIEVTRSDKGTWTILLTSPKGLTCLMAAGTHWETLKQKKAGESS